nr:hypothetical protein BdHM001_35330 [Bdellovibrio sp. HM001]
MWLIDLVSVSKNEAFLKRVEFIKNEFSFESKTFADVDEFYDAEETLKRAKCILLDCIYRTPFEIAGLVQTCRHVADKSYIIVVTGSRLLEDEAKNIHKSGTSLIVTEEDFFNSSKVEFVTSQIVRTTFVPLKVKDLVAGTAIDFTVHHLLPQNKKFLKIAKPGTVVSQEFINKFSTINELYVHRNEAEGLIEYTKTVSGSEEDSVLRACRAQFLKLKHGFTELVLLVSDQTSAANFDAGKALFEKINSYVIDLSNTLIKLDDPWTIINNSNIDDYGSLERGPAIAAYASVIASKLKHPNVRDVMLGALLSDIGILWLSPRTSSKIRKHALEKLHAEEIMEFHKHPIYSLNQCLSRKMPLSEEVKNAILQSHERADRQGFPHRPMPEKLSRSALIIRLSQELDEKMQITIGEGRKTAQEVKKEFFAGILNDTKGYPVSFILDVMAVL